MKMHKLPAGQQLLIHGTHAEQPGNFNTLFKLPHFVEDSESSIVYAFCPAEKTSLLVSSWTRILRNGDFQIFLSEVVDPRITKLKHSTPKQLNQSCEEMTEEWSAVRCVNNTFFKLNKVQMQALRGQVNVAGEKIMTAAWSVERPRRC
jgi:hypothetical protein